MLGLLNISEAMSIALHTCVWLADGVADFRSTKTISKSLGFSPNHSAKVVQQLVRAGLLETERGPSGGSRLARPASDITLLEIYVAAGGTPDYTGCLLHHTFCNGKRCMLGKQMARENKRLIKLLKQTTLDQIAHPLRKNKKGAPHET